MTPSLPPQPRRRERRPDGRLIAVAGGSRSGKTVWTAQQLQKTPRLFGWDWPKGEWGRVYRCRRVTTYRELLRYAVPGAPVARIAFHPGAIDDPAEAFERWARLAFVYIQAHGGPVFAEELASVTSAGKAPAAWGNICRMGMGYGSDIYAITQRPAESDKTALGNAVVIHSGRFNTPRDRVTMAEYLDVDVGAVKSLKPLEFLERHAGGELVHGFVTLPKRKK
jgi:hypothetical protein